MTDIARVEVVYFTDDDDKDREESVTTQIFQHFTKQVLGQDVRGEGEVWRDKSYQRVNIDLHDPFPIQDATKHGLRVVKSAYGSKNGFGWDFDVTVNGFAADGTHYVLLATKHAYLGKGHGNDNDPIIEWTFDFSERLLKLEEENKHLKKLLADAELEKARLKGVV